MSLRSSRSLLAWLILAITLVACGTDRSTRNNVAPTTAPGEQPQAAAMTPTTGAVAEPTPPLGAADATQSPAAGLAGGTPESTLPPGVEGFSNPVHDEDFPDPFLLEEDGKYYAYATNGPSGNVQTLTSENLVEWTPGEDAMPELAEWVVAGRTWAPEVLELKEGKYILYYTARAIDPDMQCLGRAISSKPEGPFVDTTKKPFVCQSKEGGSIDANPFRDANGDLYLLWKNDGNCCGMDTYIYSQKLSPDGLRLVGKRSRLVMQDALWEGILVEAPTMWTHDGKYYLFYSANAYNNETYAVGYATCKGPLGPCKDAPENPILATDMCGAAGPGHQSIIKDDDGDEWMVYHAWPPDAIGSVYPGRVVWIDELMWENGKPRVDGPTCGQQPVP